MKIAHIEKAMALTKDLNAIDFIAKAMTEPKYGQSNKEPRVYRIVYAHDIDSIDHTAPISAKALEDVVKAERGRLVAALAEIGVEA